MATAQAAPGPVYKLKRVDFFGRKVPIALQNENGPCPLLAIANILLLKKQIELPDHAPDISQNRLVSLVAGHLLDANDEQKIGKGLPEEYKANLRKNVADAIGILAKLTTGIDVNVRFHDVKGFEFTDEIAIFDLLDISLVHGWLVDPQDSAVAAALGQKSYNELVEQLVMILGDATPKRLLTPQLSRRTSGHSTPRRTTSGLAAVGPSDLLSPTEIAPSSRQTPDTQQAAAPPSVAADTEPNAGVQSASADMPDTIAPPGAVTCSDVKPPTLSDAAQAGVPTGSLVSAQQPAAADDSFPNSAADSAAARQHSHGLRQDAQNASYQQLQQALLSPAAEMASQAYPLPAAPLEGGGLSTRQSSAKFDAHIATAPTPYPSLASELSQPGSPASSKSSVAPVAAAFKASLSPLGKGSAESPTATNVAEGKGRFAPSSAEQTAAFEAETSARNDVPVANAADDQATASSAAAQAPIAAAQNDKTMTPEQQKDSIQDLGLSDLKLDDSTTAKEGQQAQTSPDASWTGLKLDEADSEQLQLALAISLGQQEAEQAQEVAEQEVHAQSHAPQEIAEPASASVSPSPLDHTDPTGARALNSLSQAGHASESANNASAEVSSSSQAGALPATSISCTSTDQDAQQLPTASASGLATVPASNEPEPSQPATGSEQAQSRSSPAGADDDGALEAKQLDLLTREAPGGQQQDQKADQQSAEQAFKDVVAQQSDSKTPLAIAAGTRRRTTSDQDERSKAAAQAHIIQDFLDSSSSQLTAHGLASLREGLRPNELAVFFRNNHFNTIFLHKGVVHILVTDQGYEFEKNVVWEKLDDLMGNTQFLKADFTPYGSNSLAEQVSDAADLVQAAFAGVGPAKRSSSSGAGEVDADFALALQLQEEEERRAARAQQAQPSGQRGSSQSRQQSSSRVSGSRGSSQGRPPSGRPTDHGSQSFINPIQRHQRPRAAQQAANQEQERSSVSSTFAKWFGFNTKK